MQKKGQRPPSQIDSETSATQDPLRICTPPKPSRIPVVTKTGPSAFFHSTRRIKNRHTAQLPVIAHNSLDIALSRELESLQG